MFHDDYVRTDDYDDGYGPDAEEREATRLSSGRGWQDQEDDDQEQRRRTRHRRRALAS